jgi:hypothetical protein
MANLDDAVMAYQRAQRSAAEDVSRAEVKVTEAKAAAKAKVAHAREALAEAIVEAARSGTRQVDIVRATGYSRERVRQICRAAGIDAE